MLNVVQNRSHVRAIVVDGRIGWTGGFGMDDITNAYFAPEDNFVDLLVAAAKRGVDVRR